MTQLINPILTRTELVPSARLCAIALQANPRLKVCELAKILGITNKTAGLGAKAAKALLREMNKEVR